MDRIEAVVSLVSLVDFSDVKSAKNFIKSLGKANGGRKGNHDTRAHNQAIGNQVEAKSYFQRSGGSLQKETKIETKDGEKSHRYMDNSFTDGKETFHVQTVDVNVDAAGKMTKAEAAMDAAKASKQIIICVAKQTCE